MPDSEVKWDYSADATEFAYSVTVSPRRPELSTPCSRSSMRCTASDYPSKATSGPSPPWSAMTSTTSDEACREALANVDPTGDVIPIYVRPDSSDMETLQTTTRRSQLCEQHDRPVVPERGIDEQWDEYVAKLNTPSLGLQDNIDIWQKYYDEAVK